MKETIKNILIQAKIDDYFLTRNDTIVQLSKKYDDNSIFISYDMWSVAEKKMRIYNDNGFTGTYALDLVMKINPEEFPEYFI